MKEERMTQVQAWEAYDNWYQTDDRIQFVEEPSGLEALFRSRTRGPRAVTPGEWADAYLSSFAQLIGATLVTFDRHLARRAEPNSLLLE